MAKKLIDIREQVQASGYSFYEYLKEVLDLDTFKIIEKLSAKTKVFVFSGVIRNFFLKKKQVRDIDLVLRHQVDVQKIFHEYQIEVNSFGGYKIKGKGLKIDLWYLEDTWAIKHQGEPFAIPLEEYIPYTAFFNFSAIVYSFNERKFYPHEDFLRFLRDRRINYVYEPNANTTLCVVNTFYYAEKYGLKIHDRLKRYVITKYKSGLKNSDRVQKHHFGKILYSKKDISEKVEHLAKELKMQRIRNSAIKGQKELTLPIWLLTMK